MTTESFPEDAPLATSPAAEDREKPRRRRLAFAITAGLAAVLVAGGIITATLSGASDVHAVTSATAPKHDTTPPAVTRADLDALPAAIYNAVIPGLLTYKDTNAKTITAAYQAKSGDVPVFGADQHTPVAKLPAKNFLGEPTVIVPVRTSAKWALVLTPARQTKPSQSDGTAAAQTAGWVPLQSLTKTSTLDTAVTVSVSAQTVTITRGDQKVSYKVGVGTKKTPTPTGTTGYLQARYEDTNQADYTIQLTSLHSAAADDPMGGTDGGLIAAHYNPSNSGTVSHGCIRLTAAALAAFNQLPLGTPITFVD